MSYFCRLSGKRKLFLDNSPKSNLKTIRTFKPNLFNKHFHSLLLNKEIRIRVCKDVSRDIMRCGGLDIWTITKAKSYIRRINRNKSIHHSIKTEVCSLLTLMYKSMVKILLNSNLDSADLNVLKEQLEKSTSGTKSILQTIKPDTSESTNV